MPTVTVVDAAAVTPRHNPQTGLTVRPTVGPGTDFEALEQAVLTCPPGRSEPIDIGEVEETLFILDGEGAIHIRGEAHRLAPEVAVYLPPGSTFVLESTGSEPLQVLAVRVPDPSPGPPSPPQVRHAAEQELESATTERMFRIVADPESGLRSATHFVGYIPTERAPEHFHTYDEVIYVLEGDGVMHAGSVEHPVAPGTCIQLPARTVHCLENTGGAPMRIVAVFRPAGSPAAAFYPDGTSAYQANQDPLQRRRAL
ncbi:MAG TPA: cupin domain-containing protein [Solirubrobacteraceae bacterium]|jgi:mannose-6-phosphate isomerase-like protein (cupin superfamily)|nr:cupin domain-containing protein [Solirubrobacteraceae bacterium]